MEALTAAAIAALTIYDMIKAVDRGAVIETVAAAFQIRRQERRLYRAEGAKVISVEEAVAPHRAPLSAPLDSETLRSQRRIRPRARARCDRPRLTSRPPPVSAMDGYAVRAERARRP